MSQQNPQKIFESKSWRVLSKDLPKGITAGIDEVGVESLAGPMTAAVVVMPKEHGISELPIDSKKLKPETIQVLATKIQEKALYIRMYYINGNQVDSWGVGKSRQKLWLKCAENIRKDFPDIKLVLDGKDKIHNINNQEAIVGADNINVSVSAASIIAKAFTDNELINLHNQLPLYNFSKHKGYGTDEHINTIKQHGISKLHRLKMTQRALEKYKPKELNLSEKELAKYLDQALGFSVHGTAYISEWGCQFVEQIKNIPLSKMTPKMQFYIKDIYDSGVKNIKRAGKKLNDVPPLSVVSVKKKTLSKPQCVSLINECIEMLRVDVNLTNDWGKKFLKSIIKQLKNGATLTQKQQHYLAEINNEIKLKANS